jgi:alpha-methylacyl-CoA racemase
VPALNLNKNYGGGALYLAFGLMAAIFERQRSGRGQVVDAAMVDGASSLLSIFHSLLAAGQWDDRTRGGNLLDGGAPFYDTYATSDGRHVALGALEPKFFAELAQRIGLPERFVKRQYDRRLWPEMRESIAAILATRTRDDITLREYTSDEIAGFLAEDALDEATETIRQRFPSAA